MLFHIYWVIEAYFRMLLINHHLKRRDNDWLKAAMRSENIRVLDGGVTDEQRALIHEIHFAVQRAARFQPTKSDCMPRSLVLRDMLRTRGLPAELKLGVQKDDGSLASHAWVEVFGDKIGEPDGANFSPIAGGREQV